MSKPFPSARALFPPHKRKLKVLRSRLRYYFYRTKARAQCEPWMDYLSNQPQTNAIFEAQPYRHYALLYCYGDKRFTPAQRREAMQYTFDFVAQKLGARYDALVAQNALPFAPLTDDISAYFNINQIDPLEGFFSLNLRDHSAQRLYDLVFMILPDKRMVITSLQGPKGEQAQALVRSLTKQLHGMRPHFMLVNLMKMLAAHWGCTLYGVAHKHQAKYRFNDHSRLLFNYDEFWAENEGEFEAQSGFWRLPTAIEQKSLEEIASKKRSMYRKRYAMLERAQAEIATF
ncbi:DUF535 domain-containing protein [Pasteurellaceae bacterium HPA106]|uniref:VirK/YbjX family protein n=1 Tax=Spirabiliibacterium pneumoniae TaxID=221400 RepID=UPI001AAC5ECC|nr:VirK/YbjX family protein [Spirabiliibacterium pneumoniae]MBE2895348.1 DUF535 domain-containing protein [Spirabiliibacterium pneumoniae]